MQANHTEVPSSQVKTTPGAVPPTKVTLPDAPVPPVETVAVTARPAVVAASPVAQMNEPQFTTWFTGLVPKFDKKNFPVGSTIKSE